MIIWKLVAMAANFKRWERDPLFSAAEIVQDSADRMESILRTLMHEHSLLQDGPAESRLLSSMEFHRRDLITALGTTKWQLEDFERAVNLSALSDKVHLDEDAMSRHKQFIRAIREQIAVTGKCLESIPVGEDSKNTQWVDLNEQDRECLAQFISGGDSLNDTSHYDNERNIMSRYLDATATASGFAESSDEIVELKVEDAPFNGETQHSKTQHLDNGLSKKPGSCLDLYEQNEKIKYVDPQMLVQLDSKGLGEMGCGAENISLKNKFRVFGTRIGLWGLLSNLGMTPATERSRSLMKRRKDGETSGYDCLDIEQMESSSSLGLPPRKQGSNFEGVAYDLRPCSWSTVLQRKFQRSQQLIRYDQFPVRATGIFVTLGILGLFVFQVA
ncbi:uncharacterized protein LOC18444797 isoform X2 [Amborella trichopoda]|nr:uncharacterized protein LOC18444797 isoform X2 [Amborella trichopoda]|eukprot:XP_006855024.2 uncharacterized protein LOC18444797 isoform X2 [Amborella trichopoda]